jgi:hypothetical protein
MFGGSYIGWIWQIRQEPSPSRSERKKKKEWERGGLFSWLSCPCAWGAYVMRAPRATTVGTQDLPPPSFVLLLSTCYQIRCTRLRDGSYIIMPNGRASQSAWVGAMQCNGDMLPYAVQQDRAGSHVGLSHTLTSQQQPKGFSRFGCV